MHGKRSSPRPVVAPYRDFALFMQDEDESIGTHRMPYTTQVGGAVGLNYRDAPLADRADDRRQSGVLRRRWNDTATPLLEAYAGDPMRCTSRAVERAGAGVQHREATSGGSSRATAGHERCQLTADRRAGVDDDRGSTAGGDERLPGDYLYGDHREPYREAGLWGILRVHPRDGSSAGVRPLSSSGHSRREQWSILAILAAAGFLSAGTFAVWRRRRRDRVVTDLPPTPASR